MKKINHPFTINPNRTLLLLSFPVLLSMTAEPLTALIDTAFIASLGSVALAALGVGTTALSSLFWIFNFLSIGAQTEVAQADGKGKPEEAGGIASLALTMAVGFGLLLILLILPNADWLASLMGASGDVQANAVSYMQIRTYGAPAVLLMLVSFGVLRGLQDMRTPLWIALGVNALNILLDWMMIFGNGPFPAMGVAGSALASTISQWLGALAGIAVIAAKLGLSFTFTFADVKRLLSVGGDLFVRTGLLTFFLAFTTRAATRIGADAGAAHQAIRQVFLFTSLALDAYATTVQSLVGYFVGRDAFSWAKKVVWVGAKLSLWTGLVLGTLMWFGRGLVIDILVPATAVGIFIPAWAVSALSQPINAVAFLTDGAHWGTGDYRFLRNAMIAATLVGVTGVQIVNPSSSNALLWVWIVVTGWAATRAIFGWLRFSPGIGQSPFHT
ncbi:MAG: MATE family efflux transporter [Anaerolineae bacterium]|jgi:multidrug resistance protein, MATE family|nr:MATE family efflux transporter [Anaerolineae bacterium]MBT7071074.1 MATE family efflux transporter [Anaerolineae bacterium]MBT7325256.1 MATE family efflux transporter [Anaerolineae bacterium]